MAGRGFLDGVEAAAARVAIGASVVVSIPLDVTRAGGLDDAGPAGVKIACSRQWSGQPSGSSGSCGSRPQTRPAYCFVAAYSGGAWLTTLWYHAEQQAQGHREGGDANGEPRDHQRFGLDVDGTMVNGQ
jgi:hypothetical protein